MLNRVAGVGFTDRGHWIKGLKLVRALTADNCGKECQTEEPGRSLRREHVCVFRLAADSPNFFLFPSLYKVHRSLLCLEKKDHLRASVIYLVLHLIYLFMTEFLKDMPCCYFLITSSLIHRIFL